MIGPDEAAAVELWPQPAAGPDVGVFTAVTGGHVLAVVTMVRQPGGLRVHVDTGSAAVVAEPQTTVTLLRAIVAAARADQAPAVVLAVESGLRLRYYARAEGFTGPLRADLVCDLRRPARRLPTSTEAQPDRLLGELHALLPGVTVEAARTAGKLRSFVRSASSGVQDTAHLSAQGPSDPRPLQLAVPLAEDIVAEGVALAVDTALSVRRRFRPLVDRVRMFFDHFAEGLRKGTVLGVAAPGVRDIHLNPVYALVSHMDEQERQVRARHPGGWTSRPGSSRVIQPPFTAVDATVAHEYWHEIEFGFESGRYRDSVEFRRAIGNYFGVETLEHAIRGGRPDAPPAWQQARIRLAEEVSAYATTAPKEATAELFKQWWCTAADPPTSAQFFGTVLRQFFPTADLDHRL